MMYKIEVYETPFDLYPKLTKQTDDALEAESSIRNLTEKFTAMREECLECGQVGGHCNSCVKCE